MKTQMIKNTMMTLVLMASATGWAWGTVASVSRDLANQTDEVLRQSHYLGDFGAPYFDLSDFNRDAGKFSFSLSYMDYLRLRDSYTRSRLSWVYLRSYQQDTFRFNWIDRDMNELSYLMAPVPPPPGPHVYSLTAHGAGGTNVGNQAGACDKAHDRAQADIFGQCSNYHGTLSNLNFSGCSCKHLGGKKYNCDVTATAQCTAH